MNSDAVAVAVDEVGRHRRPGAFRAFFPQEETAAFVDVVRDRINDVGAVCPAEHFERRPQP